MKLSDDFFSVCQTAIKSAAWKYEDFARVKGVEGELELLKASQDPIELLPTESTTAPEPVKLTTEEPPRASKDFVSPEEAKEAPVRPMPQEILDLVEAGIEVAKNPPKVREVIVEALPSDPDAARAAWSKPF